MRHASQGASLSASHALPTFRSLERINCSPVGECWDYRFRSASSRNTSALNARDSKSALWLFRPVGRWISALSTLVVTRGQTFRPGTSRRRTFLPVSSRLRAPFAFCVFSEVLLAMELSVGIWGSDNEDSPKDLVSLFPVKTHSKGPRAWRYEQTLTGMTDFRCDLNHLTFVGILWERVKISRRFMQSGLYLYAPWGRSARRAPLVTS